MMATRNSRQGASPIAGATANVRPDHDAMAVAGAGRRPLRRRLFGYDQGVISGALRGIKATFSLSPLMVEVVTSWVTLGALFGSLAGGELADRIGRKRTVLIAGAMFTLGALVQALAPDTLDPGRRTADRRRRASASPPSPRRSTPPNWRRRPLRGRFVSAYQLAITIGIFLAYLVDGWLSHERRVARDAGRRRRCRACCCSRSALVAPKSPRWLMMMHRRADAGRGAAQDRARASTSSRRSTPSRRRCARKAAARLLGRSVPSRMAPPADGRRRARGLPADHRHQRDHLLRQPDLRLRRLRHAGRADDGDHLGDRRRERARHPDRHRLHRPAGAAQAAARRADRHGRSAWSWSASRSSSSCRPPPAPPTAAGPSAAGIVTLARAGRLHHLLRLLAGPGGMDGDQRGLPRPHPRPGASPSPRRSTGVRPSWSASSSCRWSMRSAIR